MNARTLHKITTLGLESLEVRDVPSGFAGGSHAIRQPHTPPAIVSQPHTPPKITHPHPTTSLVTTPVHPAPAHRPVTSHATTVTSRRPGPVHRSFAVTSQRQKLQTQLHSLTQQFNQESKQTRQAEQAAIRKFEAQARRQKAGYQAAVKKATLALEKQTTPPKESGAHSPVRR